MEHEAVVAFIMSWSGSIPCDPPPLKWSDLRYVFDIKEDCNGKEAIQALDVAVLPRAAPLDVSTRSGLTPQSDTSHQHQRCSCLHSPRGRLRYADRLRRHAGATANLKLTFHLDPSAGADHLRPPPSNVALIPENIGSHPVIAAMNSS